MRLRMKVQYLLNKITMKCGAYIMNRGKRSMCCHEIHCALKEEKILVRLKKNKSVAFLQILSFERTC